MLDYHNTVSIGDSQMAPDKPDKNYKYCSQTKNLMFSTYLAECVWSLVHLKCIRSKHVVKLCALEQAKKWHTIHFNRCSSCDSCSSASNGISCKDVIKLAVSEDWCTCVTCKVCFLNELNFLVH